MILIALTIFLVGLLTTITNGWFLLGLIAATLIILIYNAIYQNVK